MLVRISVLENENKELKEKNKIIEFQFDSLDIFLKKSLVYSSIFGLVVGLIVSPIFLTSTNIKWTFFKMEKIFYQKISFFINLI